MTGSVAEAAGVVNEQAWRLPAASLRAYVTSYTGYRQAGLEPARHRGLPSPSVTLIFTLDDPLVIETHADPRQPPDTYNSLLGGLHARPAIITHDGRQSGVQLGLSPFGARALLNMPAGEIAHIDVSAEDVLGPLANEIRERLLATTNWRQRFAILDDVLLARANAADSRRAVSDEVSYAWRHLLRTDGSASVVELAAQTGWSDRHLRAMFRSETGLAPKEAARVIRFTRARQELQRRASDCQPLCLADLAATFGYFDQAHMDREFGLLAGCAPTTWLAEEFRNFQATAV